VFGYACKLGLEGIRREATSPAIPRRLWRPPGRLDPDDPLETCSQPLIAADARLTLFQFMNANHPAWKSTWIQFRHRRRTAHLC
jgi:hypothetical protein